MELKGDKLKFYEVQKALEEGKKIKLPDMDGYIKLINCSYHKIHYTLNNHTDPYHISESELLTDDWEIIEDIQEVKTQITISELYICPHCKTTDEYWPSLEEKVKELGYFTCGKCGQKIKPIMQTDDELCTYIKTETGRKLSPSSYKDALIEVGRNQPDTITFDNEGKITRYKIVYPQYRHY